MSIHVCVCVCVCVCIHHIFFIYSSVEGYLGCFHTLAIVSDAAVSIGGHVSFRINYFLDIYTGVELLGHMVVSLHIKIEIPHVGILKSYCFLLDENL